MPRVRNIYEAKPIEAGVDCLCDVCGHKFTVKASDSSYACPECRKDWIRRLRKFEKEEQIVREKERTEKRRQQDIEHHRAALEDLEFG